MTPTSRVAIVTGAAQGIGEAIALRLAEDGFDIAIAGSTRKPERLQAVAKAIETKGRRAIVVTGDISIEADVNALVERTVLDLGGVDMVANAAILQMNQLIDLPIDEWDEALAVNVRGVMLCFKHAARQMIKQGRGGRILGIGSSTSLKGYENLSAYTASKFAVRGLAQCAALELREHKITVNIVAPGTIFTPMTLHPDDEINGGPGTTDSKRAGLPVDTPIGQLSDVAGLVSYVAGPDAGYLTGQCIGINGGFCFN